MDISKAILAKSDVLNAVDIIDPITVTVTAVHGGEDELKAYIVTDAYGEARPYTPPKVVLRVLGRAWGKNTDGWVGRRMTIYNLPSVKYGGEVKGGVRISAMSHIDKPFTYAPPAADGLGKGAKLTIQPLPDAPDPAAAHVTALNSATTIPELQAAWETVSKAGAITPALVAVKDARKEELT